MDKHTFTPGPWRAQGLCVRAIENGIVVAEVDGPNKFFRGSERREEMEYCRGNARLIAAAPDLLQACQTFAEWLRREDVGFAALGHDRSTPEGESAWREWYDGNLALCALAQKQVRAAITKARGEATC